MPSKFYVGLDVTGFTDNGEKKPISRVTLLLDDDNALTAGDDTGAELTADCPHATQAMVDALLAQVKGYQYRAYTADDANLDPAAELGDGITAGGVYSVISRLDDDGSGYTGVSAPGEAELEDEYPAAGPMAQAFTRKIAETVSRIIKTAEEIRLEVKNEVGGLSSSIDVKLDGISLRVEGAQGDISALEQTAATLSSRIQNAEGSISSVRQTASGLTLRVENVEGKYSQLQQTVDGFDFTGLVTFTDLDDELSAYPTESELRRGQTTISGACITTGEIDCEYIYLYGQMAVYEDFDGARGGYIGYCSGYSTDGIGIMNSRTTGQCICTDSGARLSYGRYTDFSCTKSNIAASQAISEGSDRRLKHSFAYDLAERYRAMYRALKPCRYKWNDGQSDRYHTGFVAQEIEDAVHAGGLESTDLAAYCIDEDGNYSVRYTELIALNTAMIQRLMGEVDELKRKIAELEGR